MRLLPEQRRSIVNAVRRGFTKTLVADVHNVSRKTVTKWCKRAHHRQGLKLSRTSINSVLKKHGLNGYRKNYKRWKFFRAEGEQTNSDKRTLKGLTQCGESVTGSLCASMTTAGICLSRSTLATRLRAENSREHSKNCHISLMTDNGPQFRAIWKRWRTEHHIEPVSTHPYYPQDKGKVERAIRNVSEEFSYLLKKFPQWLNGKIKEYRLWYNDKRCHRGINAMPVSLYTG